MNIVFLIRSLNIGGAERQLCELALPLAAKGHKVFVIAFYRVGPFVDVLESGGCRVFGLEKRGRWDMIGPMVRCVRLIRENQIDVVYSMMPAENLFASAISKCWGRRSLVWGVRASDMDAGIYGIVPAMVHWLQRRLIKWPDAVIANSRAALVHLGMVGESGCHVVPNGINVKKWYPDPAARLAWRNALGISQEQVLIGAIGRVDPIKRLDVFLRAAAEPRAAGSDAKFLVLGPGDARYLQELKELASELAIEKDIIWSGPETQLRGVYSALDLLVSTSDSEGLSNVIAEALACGTPVVATDVGDSALLVGPHGVIVPPGDVRAVAAVMLRAKAEDSAGRNQRHHYISENFSIDSLIQDTERILSDLVDARR